MDSLKWVPVQYKRLVIWGFGDQFYIGKLQLAQNRAEHIAHIALRCIWRASVNDRHVNLSWLKVEERLTASLLVYVRGVDVTGLSVQAVGT